MIRALLIWLALTLPVMARDGSAHSRLPEPQSFFISDFANVLEPEDRARATEALDALYRETGVRGIVLTMTHPALYHASELSEATNFLLREWMGLTFGESKFFVVSYNPRTHESIFGSNLALSDESPHPEVHKLFGEFARRAQDGDESLALRQLAVDIADNVFKPSIAAMPQGSMP